MSVLLIHAVSAAADTGQRDIAQPSICCVAGKHLLLAKSESLVLLQTRELLIPNLFLYFSLIAACPVHTQQCCQIYHMQNVRRRLCFDLQAVPCVLGHLRSLMG